MRLALWAFLAVVLVYWLMYPTVVESALLALVTSVKAIPACQLAAW